MDHEDEKERTQTLPRSYKTGGQNKLVKQSNISKSTSLSRTQSANGVNLVLSSNSFVSSTMPNGNQTQQSLQQSKQAIQKPIRPVLTVQEKLAQEMPSLPPQVSERSFWLFKIIVQSTADNELSEMKTDKMHLGKV